MKRAVSMVSMVCMVFVFLFTVAGAQTTLQLYGPVGGARIAALEEFVIPKFKEKHPDVNIELIQSNSSSEKLKVLIAAGTAPDIAVPPSGDFGMLARGQYEDLTPYIQKSGFKLSNIPTEALKQFTVNGTIWALPFDGLGVNIDSIYLNLDLWNAAGLAVPKVNYDDPNSGWTYDQLRDIAKRLTRDTNGDGKNDQWGYVPSTGNGNWFRLLWSFGGDVVSELPKLRSVVNSQEVIDAFQFIRDVKFTDQVVGVMKDFPAGKVGMLEQPLAYGTNSLAKATFDWTVVATPRGKGGRWGVALNNPMGIMSTSKNKALAFEFMQFWLSDEVQIYLSERAIVPPQTYSAAARSNFIYTKVPPYDRRSFVFGRSRSMPIWAPQWPEMLAAFRPAVDEVWGKSDVPVRAIVERLHEQLNVALGK